MVLTEKVIEHLIKKDHALFEKSANEMNGKHLEFFDLFVNTETVRPLLKRLVNAWRIVMTRLRRWFFTALIVMTATTVVAAQDYKDDINWLIDVLELNEGAVVADIGAGDGELTLALARHVAPTGRIYSSELGSESLQRLRKVVDSASVSNVTVVEGDPKQTNLPEQCCDALFLRRVYHHFADPPSMNASLWQSLKPGGRLAVIDFAPRGSESEDPDGRTTGEQHGVTADTVVKELRQAGFILISTEQRSGRNIYVVMRKSSDS